MEIERGSTSTIVFVRALDTLSRIGAGKTGIVWNTSGISASYVRNKAASVVDITLATMTPGTWASGGLVELNATKQPGLYALGIPDTALVEGDGSTELIIQVQGVSGAFFPPLGIELVTSAGATVDANVVTWKGDVPADLTGDKVNSQVSGIDASVLALLSAVGINLIAPISPNSERLTLIQGQDYLLADGGVLPEWVSTDWIPFSLTTAASVTWYAKTKYSTPTSGAVHVISDSEIDIRTFANAVTRLLSPGRDAYQLQVWAVLDVAHGSAQKLLVDAPMSILNDIRT